MFGDKRRLFFGLVTGFFLVSLGTFSIKRALWISTLQTGELRTELEAKEELTFIIIGDSGSGSEEQFQVAKAMEERCQVQGGVDGLLFLGDNIYPSGVSSADDPQWNHKIEKPYQGVCLQKSQIYPVLGNHDYKGSPGAQVAYSEKNPRWHMPHRFYSLKFGHLLKIIAIDSSFPDYCLLPQYCSMDFMLDEMGTSKETWKIVLSHHPLSSSSAKGFNHQGGVFGHLVKPFVCDEVDAWFSGHAHHLEHRVDSNCESDLIVAGGGGADLYKVEPDDAAKFIAQSHGFVLLKVTARGLRYEFFNSKGDLLYVGQRQA